MSRTNYHVEIEHWLLKLLEGSNTDFVVLLRQFGVDHSRLLRDLTSRHRRLPHRQLQGAGAEPGSGPIDPRGLADRLHQLRLRRARGPAMCCARSSATSRSRASPLAHRVNSPRCCRMSCEVSCLKFCPRRMRRRSRRPTSRGRPAAKATGPTSTPSLDQFTIDLTERARQGHIDPVLGRDAELRQIVDILMRRRQNNPDPDRRGGCREDRRRRRIRAAQSPPGDVPPSLQNVSVRTLDLGLLQAGAGVKGEFENRLKSVIKEVTASPRPIILFIDEAHTLIGAGGGAGQGDAANLLKPALARGELRTIAATTWAEYKKYFEKDAALARRFQVVKVEEPDEQRAIDMMRGLVETLERHHKVRILNEAIVDAVRLSSRYISGRQLPDKALSLLDTTCARIGLSRTATPPAIEDCRRQHRADRRCVRASCAVNRRWAPTTRNNSTRLPRRRPGWWRS